MDRMGDRHIFLHYSDVNKKITFNNGGNNGHILKTNLRTYENK